jgi:Protein of unknown function (DUF1064)
MRSVGRLPGWLRFQVALDGRDMTRVAARFTSRFDGQRAAIRQWACPRCFRVLGPVGGAVGEQSERICSEGHDAAPAVALGSKAEAHRLAELRLMWVAHKVAGLRLQPRFDLVVNGAKVGSYRADFAYMRVRDDGQLGPLVVEDVKPPKWQTPISKLKIALFEVLFQTKVIIPRR